MNGEIVAIVTVGVTLAGLLVGLAAWLRQDITHIRQEMIHLRQDMTPIEGRLRVDIAQVEKRLRDGITHVSDRVGRVEHGQAKLEGLLEGLRESIAGKAAG